MVSIAMRQRFDELAKIERAQYTLSENVITGAADTSQYLQRTRFNRANIIRSIWIMHKDRSLGMQTAAGYYESPHPIKSTSRRGAVPLPPCSVWWLHLKDARSPDQ
jgi:hypothetical protein